MADPNVERWRQHSKLFVWKKNERPRMRHWAIMGDDDACDAILELLERMEHAKWPSKVTMTVAASARPPTTAERMSIEERRRSR